MNAYNFIFIGRMHYGISGSGSEIPALIPTAYRGTIRIQLHANDAGNTPQYQTIGFDVKSDGLHCDTSDTTDRLWIYGVC